MLNLEPFSDLPVRAELFTPMAPNSGSRYAFRKSVPHWAGCWLDGGEWKTDTAGILDRCGGSTTDSRGATRTRGGSRFPAQSGLHDIP